MTEPIHLIYSDKTLTENIRPLIHEAIHGHKNVNQILNQLNQLPDRSLRLYATLTTHMINQVELTLKIFSQVEICNYMHILSKNILDNKFCKMQVKQKLSQIIFNPITTYYFAFEPHYNVALINPKPVPRQKLLLLLVILMSFCKIHLLSASYKDCKICLNPLARAYSYNFMYKARELLIRSARSPARRHLHLYR